MKNYVTLSPARSSADRSECHPGERLQPTRAANLPISAPAWMSTFRDRDGHEECAGDAATSGRHARVKSSLVNRNSRRANSRKLDHDDDDDDDCWPNSNPSDSLSCRWPLRSRMRTLNEEADELFAATKRNVNLRPTPNSIATTTPSVASEQTSGGGGSSNQTGEH